MTAEWKEVVFGDLLPGGTRNGIYKPKEFHGRGAKIVNMGELFAYPRLRDVPMKRVALAESELKTATIQAGDLLFARRSLVAEGAGKCSIVIEVNEPTTFESSIIRARPDTESASSLFLYYFFNSPQGRYQLGTILRQVAVSGITGSDLVKLKLPLPPLPIQRRIAHILGTLDDKIELNRRMNRTLEKMAAAIFKSWFIDFDPVHAKADGRDPGLPTEIADLFPDSFDESEFGPIPEGWMVAPMKDLADVNARSIKKDYPHKRIHYVDISSVSQGSLDQTTPYAFADAPSRAKRLVQTGDTIWSCVRPNRKVYLYIDQPADNLVVSTGFAVLSPRIVPGSYLHQWVTTQAFVDYLTAYATGAAYPAVKADTFETAKMLLPGKGILKAFHDLVGPLRTRIAHNQRQNRRLSGLRDALLPKLMSGKIEMPVAETGARRCK